MKDRWVKHFIEVAKHKAQMSKDANTRVGAVIVSEEDMVEISSGFNCLPRGVLHKGGRSERPLKYLYTSHAESSAISNSARLGRSTKGSTLVVTMYPCAQCCAMIINAGISKIISPEPDWNHAQYGEDFKHSQQMLAEAGVTVYLEGFSMKEVTLYGLDKSGGYKVWTISTEEDKVIIVHGKEGGKLQTKIDTVKPKNIGRSNETTPSEQAELEAQSRINKQKDRGYRESKEELSEVPLLPMLAHDYLKQGHRMKYPCYVSRKLDGVRCLAICHQDRVQLKSRGGKDYHVEHIQKQLESIMIPGEVWDGELYIHGKYESGKRSADLQKYKEFMDEEFEIVAVVEDRNGNAVFECFDPTANTKFTVTYGDFEQRKNQLNNPEEYIGKQLTVKYQARYKDSKLPQFPTGVVIRSYE